MSTLSVATIKSQSTSAPAFQNSSGVEKGRLVSAWAHLDGISFHVQSSFNVSSATDHGSGDYQINFTNSFSNVNYGSTGAAQRQNSTGRGGNYIMIDTALNSSDALDSGIALATGSRAYLTGFGSTAAANGGHQDQTSSVASHGDLVCQ